MPSCGEVLMESLENYGIDTAFGIPGTHTIELYRGLPHTAIRHITPRHEQGAGFMADGYARVTGKPAVCFTVSGPGALNICTAMGQALQDSVPMLVISADNAAWQSGLMEGRLHETANLQQAMSQCARWAHTLLRADELPKVLARAFAIFTSERPGPVHITIPLDVIASDASHVDTTAWVMPSRPAPCTDVIARAANLINSADAPVIAYGGGVADAAHLARQLAELLDAPTTLTHNAKGILPPGHPLYIAGSPSFEPVRMLYQQADLVLAIGTELSETDYDFFFDGGFDLSGVSLIRIDIDCAQLARNAQPTLAIQADAGQAIKALLEHCDGKSGQGQQRTGAINQQLTALDHPDYQAFLDSIQQALPGAVVIGDSTQPVYYAASQYHAPIPRSFASAATGYGTLGYALPAALGAKLGVPTRTVVSLNGDGGIQFTIGELAAAVEARLSIAVVIWNNESYGMIAQNFHDAQLTPIACDIYTPDFVQIAKGYGCNTERACNLTEFKAALSRSQERSVPTVIEIMEKDFIKDAQSAKNTGCQ